MTASFRATAGTMLLLGVTLIGCENPEMRKRRAWQEDSLRHTVRVFVEKEENKPKHLRATLDLAARRHQRDITQTAENSVRIRQWVEDDFGRWQERQVIYRERIGEWIARDPANIERILPKILY